MVPADFPRDDPGAVSGFQAKLAVRLVDGEFLEGWTNEELYERFDACADLVEQLTAYCHRKLKELPDATLSSLLPRVRKGVAAKGWDLTGAELDWIMDRVTNNMTRSSSAE
jgi:hypothetical protein